MHGILGATCGTMEWINRLITHPIICVAPTILSIPLSLRAPIILISEPAALRCGYDIIPPQ